MTCVDSVNCYYLDETDDGVVFVVTDLDVVTAGLVNTLDSGHFDGLVFLVVIDEFDNVFD